MSLPDPSIANEPTPSLASLNLEDAPAAARLEDIADKEFDYVIIGGGTAGLCLAARLSEDPSISVAVLEGGGNNVKNPSIYVPAQYGRQLGDPNLAWGLMTEPQTFANGQVFGWHRGKGLGGSSSVNFMVWDKPSSFDIDAFEKLGNPGWNWDAYHKFTNRTETFHPPPEEHKEKYGFTYEEKHHGWSGPLHIGFPTAQTAGEILVQKTLNNIGIETVKDPYSGNITGTWMATQTIDVRNSTRSNSATAFFLPNAGRQNLTVLTHAWANKVLTTSDENKTVKATGVEFEHGSKVHIVRAKKEVILCAGAIRSPTILELSGIGDKKRLEPLGISTVIDLPTVGENVQEHMFLGVTFEVDSAKFQTLDILNDEKKAAEHLLLHAKNEGLFRSAITSFTWLPLSTITPLAKTLIAAEVDKISKLKESGYFDGKPGLYEQYEIQLEALRRDDLPDSEIIVVPAFMNPAGGTSEPGKSYITVIAALNHPFSRGSIHIKSSDPKDAPTLDPRVFEHDIDLRVLVETTKFIRKLPETQPFKDMILKETLPGPECQTDEQIIEFVNKVSSSTWHTAGSCSMLPQEKGGVVDPSLKVYGTSNIRVADLSIIPLHVAAHTQATAYGIAEQLADIIKNGS